MRNTVGKIPNLRSITSFRGDALSIDLGKVFVGELRAWLSNSEAPNDYKVFTIVENRYLTLAKSETENVAEGKWYFQVKEILNKDLVDEEESTVYQGTVRFVANITT